MKTKAANWNQFIDLIRHADSKQTLQELLDFMFTPEEKLHIATRIQLVRELLAAEKSQREIAKELNVSIAKITRGSNNLKTISTQLRDFFLKELVTFDGESQSREK